MRLNVPEDFLISECEKCGRKHATIRGCMTSEEAERLENLEAWADSMTGGE